MLGLPQKIVVFDTEFTAWEGSMERGWDHPGEYKEIVQIGAVKIDTDTLSELDSFSVFVRPVKNPTLSDYFINLTGITQEKIERGGKTYPEALAQFFTWSEGYPLYAWGNDLRIMKENADLLGIAFPFSLDIGGNIRPLFATHGIDAEQYDSSTVPQAFGEQNPNPAHDALSDARSIVQGLRSLASLG